VIARSIEVDLDPFKPSIEEKLFALAKRACLGFAGVALVLGALDVAGIHSFAEAKNFWDFGRANVLALGDTVRAGVQNISITPASLSFTSASAPESVTVRIPSSATPEIASKTPEIVAKKNVKKSALPESPVAALSAARTQDAVQVAMAGPMPRLSAKLEAPTANIVVADPLKSYLPAEPLAQKPVLAALTAADPAASAPATPAPILASLEPGIPLSMVPLPRAAPGVPPPSPAERLGLKGKDYTKAEQCLANAIYFEARSEPVRGQMAVAQVVLNRVFSGFYPDDVCSVVYQNAGRHLACQFTFACDGKRKVINERGAWARANRIARQTLEGQIYLPEVAKSTHYHANYVRPKWAREMKRLAHFGLHSFFRPYAWGKGDEDPAWGSGALAQASAKKSDNK